MPTQSLLPYKSEQNGPLSRRAFLVALMLGAALLATGAAGAGMQVKGELNSLSPPLIEALQQRLVELGYDPGPVDGQWGPRTAAAYAEFCEVSDLPVSDRLTQEHVKALWDVDFDPETGSGEDMVMFLQAIGVRF
jgi:hypothetical protein